MKVTNQGGFATCAVHAFAKCLAQGMLQKYDIAVDPAALKQQVITAVPSYRGTTFAKKENNVSVCGGDGRVGVRTQDVSHAKRTLYP